MRLSLKRIAYMWIALLPILTLVCTRKQSLPLLTKPKQLESSSLYSFDTLRKQAMSFQPSFGVPGGTLNLPLYEEPRSFNPFLYPQNVPFVYEGLIGLDGTEGKPKGVLAQSWSVSDDRLEWTFILRHDVVWSDSVRFTAFDVIFTYNQILFNDSLSHSVNNNLLIIDNKKIVFSAIDSYTVVAKLPKPYESLLYSMTQPIVPRHIFARQTTRKKFENSLLVSAPLEKMIGTGPFRIASYTPLSKIIFTKNPFYWKKDTQSVQLPYIDTIIYTLVSNQDDAVAKVMNKSLDYCSLDGMDTTALHKKDSTLSLYSLGPQLESFVIALNQHSAKDTGYNQSIIDTNKTKWFQNLSFRQAFAHCINKKELIDSLWLGRGYSQWSCIHPAFIELFDDSVTKYPFDVNKSKQLLATAGFSDSNNDKIIEDSNGIPVRFSCLVNSSSIIQKVIARLVSRTLLGIGIEVTINEVEMNQILTALTKSPYTWDMAILEINNGFDISQYQHLWKSNGSFHFWNPSEKPAFEGFELTIDSVLQNLLITNESSNRIELYHRLQKVISLNTPILYTVQAERFYLVNKRIQNINPTAFGGILYNSIEYLWLKE